MSRISETIRNKNKVEKARRVRRKNEILSLRDKSAFKAKLYDELKHVEAILKDGKVEAVIVHVPDKLLSQFGAAIYSEDLAAYDVEQVPDKTNDFYIRRKYLQF